MKNQPLLCTKVSCEIFLKTRKQFYINQELKILEVVCHLGEVHLKEKAEAKILDALEWH